MKGETAMGKLEINKRQKKSALFQTAFDLFTNKGFAKTTISDIVNQAGLAKPDNYLRMPIRPWQPRRSQVLRTR